MENVFAECVVSGKTYSMADLTVPPLDGNSFKVLETGIHTLGTGEKFEKFTVFLKFVPKAPVDNYIVLKWDFTIDYKAGMYM